jgi:antitoxin VapB
MNAPSKMTRKGKLFKSNRSQAVRIPKDLAFPDNVKEILIRRVGNKIEITPSDSFWDDFFAQGPNPDFPERFPQGEYEKRLSFDD